MPWRQKVRFGGAHAWPLCQGPATREGRAGTPKHMASAALWPWETGGWTGSWPLVLIHPQPRRKPESRVGGKKEKQGC